MLKRLLLILAFAGLLSPAYAAGIVPGFSTSTQYDKLGKVAPGCLLYVIQAGTVSTPQLAYQDSALTIPAVGGSRLTCDATGRLPQFFLADGQIKFRLTDKTGVEIFAQDNLLVVGPSSGGGGGGSVDPTTIISTGDIKIRYGTGVLTGFVRSNGRTIGSATSGATERANSDTQALFEYLWNSDANLAVSTGRGISANADWVANKTITVPDMRGRALFGMDDMGNTNSLRLSGTLGSGSTTLGGAGGTNSTTISQGNLPATVYNLTGTAATISVTSSAFYMQPDGGLTTINLAGQNPGNYSVGNSPVFRSQAVSTGGYTPAGTIGPLGGGGAFNILSPAIVITFYLKI